MGDFNFNLFEPDSHIFESSLYSNNMIPVISLATHEKPGCSQTLIDNIVINSTDNLTDAGIFRSGVSHHLPIFCFLECNTHSKDTKSCNVPKYDYCESNINKFLEDIDSLKTNKNQYAPFTERNFDDFVDTIKEKIEHNFKSTVNYYINFEVRRI